MIDYAQYDQALSLIRRIVANNYDPYLGHINERIFHKLRLKLRLLDGSTVEEARQEVTFENYIGEQYETIYDTTFGASTFDGSSRFR